MDRFERFVLILILLTFGFIIFCLSEYQKLDFIGKALTASLGNAAALLSLYLFLKYKE